jgi:riboflavin kinase/FMN adenylyltransferase
MDVVPGIDALAREHGPAFVVVGVFDGLHVGHRYLLDHLVTCADERDAKPMVITFDHHPDEILTGTAPPLLLDPEERLERLAAAGVEVTVVQHFDAALRQTPYDVFVERIRARVALEGFLMTPDAAFGFERRGTPESLAVLGERDGFEVVVVPPFDLGGRPVRSSEIREAIAKGDLGLASALLGRPVTLTGWADDGGADHQRLRFSLPTALPPDGEYRARIAGADTRLEVSEGEATIRTRATSRRVTVELLGN